MKTLGELGLYQRRRRFAIGGVIVLLVIALIFVRSQSTGSLHEYIEAFGISLIVAAIIGRMWCTLYIGGRKSAEIVQSGPYSVTRNPLYVFSSIGAVGIAPRPAASSSRQLSACCVISPFRLSSGRRRNSSSRISGDLTKPIVPRCRVFSEVFAVSRRQGTDQYGQTGFTVPLRTVWFSSWPIRSLNSWNICKTAISCRCFCGFIDVFSSNSGIAFCGHWAYKAAFKPPAGHAVAVSVCFSGLVSPEVKTGFRSVAGTNAALKQEVWSAARD